MPDFRNARVGDRVFWWSNDPAGPDQNEQTNAVIISINYTSSYPIRIKTDSKNKSPCFNYEGRYSAGDAHPTLFWSRPEMSDPPPPKRKMKVWVNIYYTKSEGVYPGAIAYPSKQSMEIDNSRDSCKIGYLEGEVDVPGEE